MPNKAIIEKIPPQTAYADVCPEISVMFLSHTSQVGPVNCMCKEPWLELEHSSAYVYAVCNGCGTELTCSS